MKNHENLENHEKMKKNPDKLENQENIGKIKKWKIMILGGNPENFEKSKILKEDKCSQKTSNPVGYCDNRLI